MKRCSKLMAALLLLAYGSVAKADFETVNGVEYEYYYDFWSDAVVIESASWGLPAIDILTAGALTIPSELGGYPVREIGEYAFANCANLTDVVIPAGIELISWCAFENCTGLTNVVIGVDVAYIGFSAFSGCTGLTDIPILSKDTYLEANTFYGCTGLTDVTIPGNIFDIGPNVFYGCTGLTNVVMEVGIEYISNSAFGNCVNLATVSIPTSVIGIGYNAFVDTAICANQPNNAVVYIGGWAVGYNGTLSGALVFQHGTRGIAAGAFDACDGLTSVTIPAGIKDIADSTFQDCAGLTSVVIEEGVQHINGYAFYGCESLRTVTIPGSVIYIEFYAFADCTGLTSVVIEEGVEHIGEGVFEGCESLVSVTIPGSVTTIISSAFYNCTGLTSVVMEEGVEYIGEYAFAECENLAAVTIPASVIYIWEGAFRGCEGLVDIIIPPNVTVIGKDAFLGTAFWNNQPDNAIVYSGGWALGYKGAPAGAVIFETGTKGMASYMFAGCDGLTSVTIPASMKSIVYNAFQDCIGLASVVIEEGVEYIGEYAFSGCEGLQDVTIPGSVAGIGYEAFAVCTGLTNVTIGAGVNYIDMQAFYGCGSLKNINLPTSITNIGEDVFAGTAIFENSPDNDVVYIDDWAVGYKGTLPAELVIKNGTRGIATGTVDSYFFLTSVTIPEGVLYIGNMAFMWCHNLAVVNIPSSATSVGSGVFHGTAFWNNHADDSVVYVDGWACGYKGTLPSELVLQNDTKGIADFTFSDCADLTSVTIPASVVLIGRYPFDECTKLQAVHFEGNAPTVSDTIYGWTPGSLTTYVQPGSTGWNGSGSTTLPDLWPLTGDDCRPIAYANDITVTFSAAGGTPETQTIDQTYGAHYILPETEPVLDGYAFGGWWDTSSMTNAVKVTSDTLMDKTTAHTLHAQWMPACSVTFDANGGTPAIQTVATPLYGNYILPETTPVRDGYTFAGWTAEFVNVVTNFMSTNLVVTVTTNIVDVTAATPMEQTDDHTVYAQWTEVTTPSDYLSEPVATAAVMTTTTYAGFAYDSEDGTMRGTMTLSAKAAVRTSKGVTTTNWTFTAKAVLQNATVSFSAKAWADNEPGNLRIVTRTSEVLNVRVEGDRFWGEISGGKVGATLTVDGARDVFANRKDAEAQERLTPLKGYYTTALLLNETQEPAGYLTLTIGNLGAVKYAGKMKDGTSVSGSVKLLEGLNEDGWYAVGIHKPLYSKKGFMGGLLWLDPADQVLRVDADEGWFVDWVCADPKKTPVNEKLDVCGGYFGDGKTGTTLAPSYGFSMTMPENLPAPAATLVSGEWMTGALPLDLTATVTGVKFVFPKAATPKKDKATGLYDYALENPSGLKLTYTARTGLFKGSFKMYYDGLTNRDVLQHKTVTVSYTGVLTPVRDGVFAELPVGLGTGTATINRQKIGMPVYLLSK